MKSLKINNPALNNAFFLNVLTIRLITAFFFTIIFSIGVHAQDVFEIKFTAGYTQYRGALVIYNSGSGKMRVRYYSNGKTKMVEQTMKIENTQYGMRLTGYNPVYPNTSIKHPSYNADNFYISVNENGKYSITNIDDGGTPAKTTIRLIKGKYSIDKFLGDFNWELNSTSTSKQIYFKNTCSSDIKLAVRYRYNDESWTTKYWYNIDGNERTYLSSNGNRLTTNNSIVYIYAKIPGENYEWSGEKSRYINGEYYDMMEYEMNIDSDGDYYISLNCLNR
ncbi:hypothetical protein Q4Q39_02440 [Flavivirga amylovorans]|uniref:DUF4595 domain-containing protein n=1 Tax=Flavivirga amylovorans TaxID=870486 RepID=A0ABT8WX30_9FLAO|nr:hypothetical protein [Flavivirga amylovorans]MDO5986252.1 hypothetical protein [Flavivirga amylovorans]